MRACVDRPIDFQPPRSADLAIRATWHLEARSFLGPRLRETKLEKRRRDGLRRRRILRKIGRL